MEIETRFPCMETEFVELVFHVWKSSSLNSFSLNSEDGPSLNSEDNECLAASNVWMRLQKMDRDLVVGFA